ncbi:MULTISPECIES: calcium-binding protein [unclassified Pseudomonas]|uniref:calcium-binding protein n=1 Tax=unclassified Pseudomonas TaxID=196821 RepID=UPI0021CAC376|nr:MULTISPECIES: calcium-binding protein [unclassified Pseudomonas]MCU1733595.1 hypothetical protein [Pseudomonas sp. 20P_3.2_Bac4]MCU1743259.1 hypothetical protein [Pseudomonas sp. 20P_3.2_Bac5]
MPSVTVKVTLPGASLTNGGNSFGGHMWFDLKNGAGETGTYGFGPETSGTPVGPGNITHLDNSTYEYVAYSQTIEISDAQYAAVKKFVNDPAAYGFDVKNYNWLNNSCVDFVWGAMGAGGINPAGYEGKILPIANFERLFWTKQLFDKANETVSPLILDLDGDGVETLGKSSNIYFDHDGTGFAEQTGWVGADDGVLVWDRNGNGRIDDGSELFGNHTVLANGQKAANGFAALAQLDSNQDGKVDSSDGAFAQLRIWKDSDSNARLGEGELLTLDQANVASIGTAYINQTQVDVHGNEIRQAGSYTNSQGAVHDVKDVWFSVDNARTVDLNLVTLRAEVQALPNAEGSGNVASLHQAMARDGSGTLKELVEAFAGETNATARQTLVDKIIFAWSGASQYGSSSRGGYIDDGRKIYALEAFLGSSFIQSSGTNVGTGNPGPNAAAKLMQAYAVLSDSIAAELMLQTHYQPLVAGLLWTFDGNQYSFDVAALVQTFRASYNADPVAGKDQLLAFAHALDVAPGVWNQVMLSSLRKTADPAGQGFDQLLGDLGHTLGGGGNDELYGDVQANVLVGLSGNDTLYGDAGNDALDGGSGNDYLSGDAGSDTYHFSRGWGQDTLNNFDSSSGKQDVIVFDATVATADVRASRAGDNLVLSLAGSTDKVTVVNFFINDGVNFYQIEQVRFNDGTVWTPQQIMAAVALSTDGNDTLYGYSGADTLSSGTGNDILYAAQGNDVLVGGSGNDRLEGGSGSDTYLFNLGDGKDVILENSTVIGDIDVVRFGEGVLASDISVSTQGANLLLRHANGLDQITVLGWFNQTGPRYQIERIEFADGTLWTGAQLSSALLNPVGTEGDDILTAVDVSIGQSLVGNGGNDTLTGGDGGDRLEGGRGNDRLNGGQGSDRYVFNLGDGQDVIFDDNWISSDTDVLSFGASVAASDITASRSGTHLVLSHANGQDRVTIIDWFYQAGGRYKLEKFEFADGTVITGDQMTTALMTTMGTDADDTLEGANSGNQTMLGLGGNDTITSGSGSDMLEGGLGNDVLSAGDGNDVLIGGRGNDRLNGGRGDDRYVFNFGDGQDVIFDDNWISSGTDVLSFGAGIAASDVTVSRSGTHLVLNHANGQDRVTILDWSVSSSLMAPFGPEPK